jgi:hypothetical protein
MKRLYLLILVVSVFLAISLPAQADSPSYNFASSQATKNIKVNPNSESAGSIYFYNIDGNLITHVILEVSQSPANWQVTIQPPLGETRVEIGGKIISVNETLYIEPSQVLSQKMENPPAGMVCIAVPPRGFALAKEAKVIVRVPGSEKIGTQSEIVVSATAQWLGQSGAAAITQSRDFNFSVEVVSAATDTKEKILGKAGNSGATSGDTGGTTGGITVKWRPVIIGAVAVVVVAILILLYLRTRRD